MVRTFNYLFDKIRALNNEEEFCKIKASYLEIYNEKTIDLLNQGSKRMNLPLRWNKQNQAFNVENLFIFSCTETQDLVNILLEGTKNRALGSHRFVFFLLLTFCLFHGLRLVLDLTELHITVFYLDLK